MGLSEKQLKEFAGYLMPEKKQTSAIKINATVHSIDTTGDDPIYYVNFDGAEGVEPCPVSSTLGETVLNTGDRVAILIQDREGTIVGNLTAPADETIVEAVEEIVEEVVHQMEGIYEFINAAGDGTSTVIDGGSIKTGTLSADKVIVGSNVNLDTKLDDMDDDIDAAMEASNCVTIDGYGVRVRNINYPSNYTKIDSDGFYVYQNYSELVHFTIQSNTNLEIGASRNIAFAASVGYIMPTSAGGINLGSNSYYWNYVYGGHAYQNVSDGNLKHNIKAVDDKYIAMIDEIEPITFMYDSGDRTHAGYIAQQVFEAMQNNGLTDMDFGGFCRDSDDASPGGWQYSLRYEEFIAILHAKVKTLETRIEELERNV